MAKQTMEELEVPKSDNFAFTFYYLWFTKGYMYLKKIGYEMCISFSHHLKNALIAISTVFSICKCIHY